MKIGQLAKATMTTVETIRYYEKEGLLPEPARTHSGYRNYGAAHLERLRLIRNCRALDMAQDEIRAILTTIDHREENCDPINHIFDKHIQHVDTRIAELQELKQQLAELRQRCESPQQGAGNCGILHGLNKMPSDARIKHHTHLG